MVPVTPQHASVAENKNARKVLESFRKLFLTAFSDADAVTAGGDRIFQERVRGARGQERFTIRNAGHFVQENQPDELIRVIDEFIRTTS